MSRTLLRGARVITMAPDRPDVESIDLLVDGDIIAAADAHIPVPDAEVIDCSGSIIIPGLVNAHLHTWQTALRGIGADWSLLEYLSQMHGHYSHYYQPDDIYIGTLFGALSQMDCGTTTIGDGRTTTGPPNTPTRP